MKIQEKTPISKEKCDATNVVVPTRMMNAQEVARHTGISVSSIYKQIRNGSLPKGIKLTSRSVRWQRQDIDAWIDQKIAASEET